MRFRTRSRWPVKSSAKRADWQWKNRPPPLERAAVNADFDSVIPGRSAPPRAGFALLTRGGLAPTQRGPEDDPAKRAFPFCGMLQSERVAQAVEHVTFNHGVAGSSPAALTKKSQENQIDIETT